MQPIAVSGFPLRYGLRLAFGALLAAAVAGCASDSASGDARKLEITLAAYHSALRWEGVDRALELHDPERIAARPITPFELERWRQFRVVGYREQPPTTVAPGRVRQRVALELINLNTQGVRSVIDLQEWRYDQEAQRWWLTSGLPSLDAR